MLRDVKRSIRPPPCSAAACPCLVLAPTGFTRIADPEGEHRGRPGGGSRRCLLAVHAQHRSIEEVAAVSDGPKWFQVLLARPGSGRDDGWRAAGAGFEALVLTVDSVVLGRRERDHAGVRAPSNRSRHVARRGGPSGVDLGLRPLRTDPLRERPGRSVGDGADAVSLAAYVAAQYDQGLTWADVDWLRSIWSGPIVEHADRRGRADAADTGVEAVALSNHGRQLDSAPAPIDLVAPVVDWSATASRSSATRACGGAATS